MSLLINELHRRALISQFHKKRERNWFEAGIKKKRTTLSPDCVMKVERSLLLHSLSFEKPRGRDRTLCVERHVRHWSKRLLSAGRYLASRIYVHTYMYVPIERLALNWTHVARNDARWLLRFKWENATKLLNDEKKAESRVIRAIVAVALISSRLLSIFTVIESCGSAITNARCVLNVLSFVTFVIIW